MQSSQTNSSWKLFKQLLADYRQHRILLVTAISCILLEAISDLMVAAVLKTGVDSITSGSFAQLLEAGILFAVITLAAAAVIFIRRLALGRFGEQIGAEMRQRVVEKLNRLPISYLEKQHSGDLISRLTNDAALVGEFLVNELMPLIYNPLVGLLALIYLIIINWQLTAVVIVLTPILAAAVSLAAKPIHQASRNLQDSLGEVNGQVQDGIAGSQEIKAFGIETGRETKFRDQVKRSFTYGLKLAKHQSIIQFVSYTAGMTPFIVCFGYGGYLAVQGRITIGYLFAFINLLNHISNPLTALPHYIGQFYRAMAAYGRIQEILDVPEEQGGSAVIPADSETALEFAGVSFGYNDVELFRDLSFKVKKGETTAIVGPSGAGKSTIFKLIAGFYRPQAGTIKVFGRELAEWDLKALRQQIALVTQDPHLYPPTIRANIGCGQLGASDAQIRAAAEAAAAHSFIVSQPQGYDTIVGERGSRLSGGQKQRIAIARALLKDAELLLLDEPTSALDVESEHLVQQALEQLMEGRTTLVIAHRLSTIKNADRILVIDQGRIVESGTHEQLFAARGVYYHLYQTQLQQAG